MEKQFPSDAVELTTLLVVTDIERSRRFYQDVLGATVFREYGGTSCVLSFQGSWLLLVIGGGPTKDKPGVTSAPPPDPNMVSRELTIRVPDCQAAYEILKSKGAEFLTPPVNWGGEVRCFFPDPDGHLLEISPSNVMRPGDFCTCFTNSPLSAYFYPLKASEAAKKLTRLYLVAALFVVHIL